MRMYCTKVHCFLYNFQVRFNGKQLTSQKGSFQHTLMPKKMNFSTESKRRAFAMICTSLLFACTLMSRECDAFSNPSPFEITFDGKTALNGGYLSLRSREKHHRQRKSFTREISLQGGLFGNLFGGNEEADPNVPKRIFSVKCDSIKPGGLRFALGLYLIGMQGTPVKGSWKANQASDGVLDMYYVDNSAMFSVNLEEKQISVDRYGVKPSLTYLLQESVILHGLLDELQTLALGGEDDIKDENRLLVLSNPTKDIDAARGTLPARAAQ